MLKKVIEFIKKAQAYTKFWVAVAGGILVILAGNLDLPADVVKWVQVAIQIATVFSVYKFPNAVSDIEE